LIKAVNTNIPTLSNWSIGDNFVSAETPSGSNIPLSEITVSVVDPNGQTVTPAAINTGDAGDYKVTYTYGNETSTVTVSVYKREGTADLSGTSSSTYNGQTQTPNVGDYMVTLSNGSTYTLKSGDVTITPDDKNAGTYTVSLTQQGLNDISQADQGNAYNWVAGTDTASFVVSKVPITITANNASKIAGTSDPQLTATVTMPSGLTNPDVPVYTVTRTAGETAGTYPITITYNSADNPNYDITVTNAALQITPNLDGVEGSNYTMHIGDPTPTAKDFNATATNDAGQQEPVNVDLSQANLTAAGTYNVGLSTTDGQSKTVQLTVLADSESGDTVVDPSNTTDPTDPTDPSTSTDPTVPTDPASTDPTVTTDPTTTTDTNNMTNSASTSNESGNSNSTSPATSTTSTTDPTDSSNSTSSSKPVDPTQTVNTSTDNSKKNIVMSGTVYYVPGNKQTAGVLVAPRTVSNVSKDTNNQTPIYQESGLATFPQTGNGSGTWMQILGVIIGILTLGVIDIRKNRHQA